MGISQDLRPHGLPTFGIDEAGYGPLLGPLIVARADFADDTGGRPPKSAAKGPTVDDSKKVFSGKGALAKLETTVLSYAAAAIGRVPTTLDTWLDFALDPETKGQLDRHPWYRDRSLALPCAASADHLARAATEVAAGKTSFRGFRIAVCPEIEFNRRLSDDVNKHEALVGDVARLIADAAEKSTTDGDDAEIVVYVDKLGGRNRYAEKLRTEFPFVVVETIEEERKKSRYRLGLSRGTVDLSFAMKGDGAYFAVALASMAAKYTREVMMILFNRYWTAKVPGIRPTAGYYVDGSRFVADLERAGVLDGDLRRMLVRER